MHKKKKTDRAKRIFICIEKRGVQMHKTKTNTFNKFCNIDDFLSKSWEKSSKFIILKKKKSKILSTGTF